MLKNKEFNSVGDLLREVKEVQKVSSVKEAVDNRTTSTTGCGLWHTLRCC